MYNGNKGNWLWSIRKYSSQIFCKSKTSKVNCLKKKKHQILGDEIWKMAQLITEWGWPWAMVWREHWLPNFYTTRTELDKMRKCGKSNWEGSSLVVEKALLFSNQSTWTPLHPPQWMFLSGALWCQKCQGYHWLEKFLADQSNGQLWLFIVLGRYI